MSIISDAIRVKEIITRFKRCPPHVKDAFIGHYADCKIWQYSHRSMCDRAFCDCGLIYELYRLDMGLPSILYDKFNDDWYLHETGKKWKPTKKQKKSYEDSLKVLESIFGKFIRSMDDINYEYDYIKRVLKGAKVTKREFPSIHQRLENWLKKEKDEHDKATSECQTSPSSGQSNSELQTTRQIDGCPGGKS